MMGFMSTSLKVVSMAVSFLTPTKRSATLRRSMLIFSLRTSRLPDQPAPGRLGWGTPAANALKTSCFKHAATGARTGHLTGLQPDSSMSFRAAGEG